MKLKKHDIYIVVIRNKANEIINELGLMKTHESFSEGIEDTLIIKECCKRSYLRGAF